MIDCRKRKTKKEHKCFGCSATIPTGTIVDYFVNTIQDFSYGYICNDCERYLESHKKEMYGIFWYEGELEMYRRDYP